MRINFDLISRAGLEFLPHQKEGIKFALQRQNTLIADEMGLGKTIQAIGVINAIRPDPILIVCPASLKINWERELKTWLTYDYGPIGVSMGQNCHPWARIVIINYEILHRNWCMIDRNWGLVVFDESQYLANPEAKRTYVSMSLRAGRRIFLTGTPIMNSPKDLWVMLHLCFPDKFKKYISYMINFCGAKETKWGWDFSGKPKNTEVLKAFLKKHFMIRRLKSEILNLPEKTYQIIPIRDKSKVVSSEIRKNFKSYLEGRYHFSKEEYQSLAEERHESALAKIPIVEKHLRDLLQTKDKIIVFGYHTKPLKDLHSKFKNSVLLIGETSHTNRQTAVDSFQTDPRINIFFANIRAAGVGLNLTVAGIELFIETDWTPARVLQAIDRAHRIGQKNKLLIQFLTFEDSIDELIARILVDKQDMINKII